jgi:hypothetical protein
MELISQQLLRYSRKSHNFIEPEVHYRMHKSPPLVLPLENTGINIMYPQINRILNEQINVTRFLYKIYIYIFWSIHKSYFIYFLVNHMHTIK